MTALSLPRPRRVRPLAVLAASLALVAASQLAMLAQPAPPASMQGQITVTGPLAPPEAPLAALPGSLERIDRSISAWTTNLAANDKDFLAAGNLAVLYEARARLSGDVGDFGRAEEAANRSLAIEPRQLDVQALHARIQLALHDFSRALTEASAIDRTAPDQPAVLAIIADARLELGDVSGATAIYDRLAVLAPGPAVTARQARVAFLRGDTASAVSLATAAHDAAVAAGDTGPGLSWYAYLAGTLSLSAGDPEGGARWLDRALAAWPGSYLALAGRARAAAAAGELDAAIAGYRAAIAVAPQPDAVAALGDLLELRGDADGARQQRELFLAIATLQGSDAPVFDRQLVLFSVDTDGDVAGALATAEAIVAEREDAYALDAHAWALHGNGRDAEADAAIGGALATGIRDATLLFHAGSIAASLGDDDRARDLLEKALAIRGALDPLRAADAAATLATLS